MAIGSTKPPAELVGVVPPPEKQGPGFFKTPAGRAYGLGVAMFAPAVLYIVALIGVPFVMAFLYAFGDVRVGSVGYHFVGLENYRHVIQSPTFRTALKNSFIFTIS